MIENVIFNLSFIGFNGNDILKYGKDIIYWMGFLLCLFCIPEKKLNQWIMN